MNKAGDGKQVCPPDDPTAFTRGELQTIRKEIKAEAEKLKALETRVGVIEQNLLGN